MFCDTEKTSLVGGTKRIVRASKRRTWVRTSSREAYCVLDSINSERFVVTGCTARFHVDAVDEITDQPAEDNACVDCLRLLLELRMTELGLAELEEVTRG